MNKNNRWFPISLLLVLAACTSKPQFINHTPPGMPPVAFDEFTNAGCPAGTSDQPCGADSPLADFGCNEILIPSNLLGGLEPAYPMAICQIDLFAGAQTPNIESEIERGEFIYHLGGLLRSYIRYVVFQNGEYRLLKTEDEFRNVYAPIESPEETLSYVLAVTRYSAYYGLEYNPSMKYEVSTLEDTHVTSESDGYLLHLYFDQVFGCGPHWTSAVDVHLSFEGAIKEVGQTQVFRDPQLDDLCVD
jgi:hypothetical protein